MLSWGSGAICALSLYAVWGVVYVMTHGHNLHDFIWGVSGVCLTIGYFVPCYFTSKKKPKVGLIEFGITMLFAICMGVLNACIEMYGRLHNYETKWFGVTCFFMLSTVFTLVGRFIIQFPRNILHLQFEWSAHLISIWYSFFYTAVIHPQSQLNLGLYTASILLICWFIVQRN